MLKKFTAKAMQEGHYYVASGVLVYLEKIVNPKKPQKGHITIDGRTRTIYENGMESDIKLHTLSKNVYTDGYIVTDSTAEDALAIEKAFEVTEKDKADGWIYVLSSLSENPEIAQVKDLYKIGFSTTPVEERIRNCEYEPTYLMDKVRIVATWKTYNMKTHFFETLIHQFFKAVQFHVKVKDLAGNEAEPREWFVVPLGIISKAVESIIDGSIVNYRYNPAFQVIEEVDVKRCP
ncbi:MAG: GIY-YIG nuclease family protein [Bacteroidaceae bacterium]|nr:GIY-YIG nuclease family protein [Bacteroidaceae bacterium]